jgi:hypothetical protein
LRYQLTDLEAVKFHPSVGPGVLPVGHIKGALHGPDHKAIAAFKMIFMFHFLVVKGFKLAFP